MLSLYYGVGKFISENSRGRYWGKGAIKQLSEDLQRELPGLRGFGEVSLKKMRLFYEAWQPIFANRQLPTDDLKEVGNQVNRPSPMDEIDKTPKSENRPLPMGELSANRQLATDEIKIISNFEAGIDLSLLSKHIGNFDSPEFFVTSFYKVGFTHHSEILAKEKSLEGRFFYISHCAAAFWSVEALKSHLRGELYQSGRIPNNFLLTLPEQEQAQRAIRSFKDEYFLDFVNIEDENDPDERLIGRSMVANIKQFILSFGGNKFCFMGHEHRIIVDEEEIFIDLLFFHRELRCLVAVELKRGKFNPAHLGQLNFYLSALDEYVRQEDEAPSIGILLCKEAKRSIVEFAVRDYTKPMGVATYRTRNEMPEELQKALPDVDAIKQVLDSSSDEQEGMDE